MRAGCSGGTGGMVPNWCAPIYPPPGEGSPCAWGGGRGQDVEGKGRSKLERARGAHGLAAGPWASLLAQGVQDSAGRSLGVPAGWGGQAAGSSWAFCSCPVSGEAAGSGVGWLQGAGLFGGTLRRRRRKTRLLHAGGQNETGQRGRDPRLLELRPWSQGSFLGTPGDPLRAAPCPLVPA